MIRYGRLVTERELPAIELFQQTMDFFRERLARQEITFFEPFFFMTSDLEEELGFFIVRGPAPAMFQLLEDETYRTLVQRAMALVEHVRIDWLTVGEGIAEQVERSMKIHTELAQH